MATNTRKLASLLGASGAGIANAGTLTSAAIGDVIVSGDIADDAIDSEHLAPAIAISTSGNIATTGSGTLSVAGASTLTGASTHTAGLLTNTIGERTSTTGVTIDSLLIKDGSIKIPSAGAGVFRSDGTTALLSEASSVATLDNVTLGSSVLGFAGYRLSGVTVYSTVAAHTWTKPADVTAVYVIVTGSGGGGGGNGSLNYSGGGGGGGGTAIKFITSGLGATETATIGAAGTAGAGGQNNGGSGGTTSFGSHCSATGGGYGHHGNTNATTNVTRSTGGDGIGGDLLIRGGTGGHNRPAGVLGGNTSKAGGPGGPSYWGGGGGEDTTGANASVVMNGSGGGGGAYDNHAGGAGGVGVIVIYEYKGGA